MMTQDNNDLPSHKSIDDASPGEWDAASAAYYSNHPRGETPEAVEPSVDSGEVVEALTGVVRPKNGAYLLEDVDTLLDEVDEPERSKVLAEANSLINGARQSEYGTPQVNFQRIANLWNVLIPGHDWKPGDVALAMLGLKMARAAQGYKRDTYVDIAGYAALAVELNETDNG
jgi:hypothetical protein